MNENNSLAHTKWNCKYHIVFAPKYRRRFQCALTESFFEPLQRIARASRPCTPQGIFRHKRGCTRPIHLPWRLQMQHFASAEYTNTFLGEA